VVEAGFPVQLSPTTYVFAPGSHSIA